ncbi:MAG: hypothetical protein WCI20_14115 [bacterium]
MKSISGVLSAIIFVLAYDGKVCRGGETGFLPSPDGKSVASVVRSSIEIPFGPEMISFRQTVSLRVRSMDGKEVMTLQIKKAKELYQVAYGYLDLAWSPDSRMVAYRSGADLAVVDITTKTTTQLGHSAGSMRWFGSSQIVHVAVKGSVDRVSVITGVSETLFRTTVPEVFHSSTSPFHNQLSPDCRWFVTMDGKNINVVDLNKKAVVSSQEREMKPVFCWWNDASDRCLINGLADIKTGDAWPHDTGFLDVLYCFRSDTGQFEDLTYKLGLLNGNSNATPRPDASAPVWFADGHSFLVSGCVERKDRKSDPGGYLIRHWICRFVPWSSLCIQDANGQGLVNPRLSPHGDFLMMNKENNKDSCDGDWFLSKVSYDAEGNPQLSKPITFLPSSSGDWFWDADGKGVVTFKNGRFRLHRLP